MNYNNKISEDQYFLQAYLFDTYNLVDDSLLFDSGFSSEIYKYSAKLAVNKILKSSFLIT